MFMRIFCDSCACRVLRPGEVVQRAPARLSSSFVRSRLVAHNPSMRCPKMGPAGTVSMLCFVAKCSTALAEKPRKPDPGLKMAGMDSLTHEYLIKQASTLTVDSATQLVTQTVNAFIEASQIYREAMDDLIEAMSDCMEIAHLGGSEAAEVAQELWDREIEARLHVTEMRKTVVELDSYMEYASKVATAAAEASFLAGSEYASTAMCERLNSAQKALEEEKEKNRKAEGELLHAQQAQAMGTSSDPKASTVTKKKHPLKAALKLDSSSVLATEEPSKAHAEQPSEPHPEEPSKPHAEESDNTCPQEPNNEKPSEILSERDSSEPAENSSTSTASKPSSESSGSAFKPKDLLDFAALGQPVKEGL